MVTRRQFLDGGWKLTAAGLFVPTLLRAQQAVALSRRKPAASEPPADGPNVWYYGVGSDNYTSEFGLSSFDCVGDDITCTVGGSLTKLSVKNYEAGSETAYKVGLFYNNGGTWTLHGSVTVASTMSVGWNDVTLSSPRTVSAGEVVRVMVIANNSWFVSYSGTTTGMFYSSTYATEFVSTPTFETNDYQFAVRCYVD